MIVSKKPNNINTIWTKATEYNNYTGFSKQDAPPSTRELADRLECTEKTIDRNLRTLQDQHNAPLHRKPRQGWVYDDKNNRFELPGIWRTNDELLGLATILSILQGLNSSLLSKETQPIAKQHMTDAKLNELENLHTKA